MSLSRRSFAAAMLLAALWLLPAPRALSQSTASSPGGTIVVLLFTVTPGTPTATAVAGMKDVLAFMKTQPGLIEESLLASSFPGNKPSHIHLMRWRSLSDWEALPRFAGVPVAAPVQGRVIRMEAGRGVRARRVTARTRDRVPNAGIPLRRFLRHRALSFPAAAERYARRRDRAAAGRPRRPRAATASRKDAGTTRRRARAPSAIGRRAGRPRPRQAPARPVRRGADARSRAAGRRSRNG